MGHVEKVIETHNRFSHLTVDEEDDEAEGQWEKVTRKSQPRQFSNKSKVSLTTRKLTESPKGTKRESPKVSDLTEKLIANAEKLETSVCQMTFHVTDANKILASVNKMTEAGNHVHFTKRRSYIESPDGKRATMRKRGGVYVLDVIFFDGESAAQGEVIVDSGAA